MLKTYLRLVSISLLTLIGMTSLNAQIKERLPCVDKTFSVAVHVVIDSLQNPNLDMQDVYDNFEMLNELFDPICVDFEICEEYLIENWWYDEHSQQNHWEEKQVLYNRPNRINVYYVIDILDPGGMAGYATLGGITQLETGGIVLDKENDFRTLAHEMGHYFGLSHTFEGSGIELVNGDNCEAVADSICDTPADPYDSSQPVENYVNEDCEFIFMGQDANGEYYNPLVGNIMSYYPADCDCGFTHGQYKFMAETYLSGIGMW